MKYSLFLSVAAACMFAAPAVAQQYSLADDAKAFGARDAAWSVDISPDGKRLAMLVPGPGRTTGLRVIDLATVTASNLAKTEGNPDSLRSCEFASNEQIVCTFGGNATVDGIVIPVTRLFSISADGKTVKQLGQKEHVDSAFRENDGEVIDLLPKDEGAVLMARYYVPEVGETGNYNRETREGLGVDRVDLSNFKITHVESPRAAAVQYITDDRGNVRLLETLDTDHENMLSGVHHFFYRTTDSRDWKPLGEYEDRTETGVDPIAVDAALNVAYVLKKVGGRDALFTMKLDGSGTMTQVAANPKVDIAGVVRFGRGQRVIGYTYSDDREHVVYFDPEFSKLHDALSNALGLPMLEFEGASSDGSKLLIFASSDTDPGHYYVFDRATRHLDEVAARRPELKGRKLPPEEVVSVPAADGVQIPAYLTLPASGVSKNLPAVILPHGGPAARDEWGWDTTSFLVQFLAARGYAVIQPEFRGSAGYGDEWMGKNGFKDWKTAISDISASAKYLVDKGIADPKRLAMVGWSYGGYAALQSAVVQPSLYKAAVAIAPVTDLGLWRAQWDNYTNKNVMREYIGSGENLAEGSPLRHASEIKVPVLLFHGDLDLNVNVSESEKMESALKSAGDKAELVEFHGLDHQLDDSNARTQMLTRIGQFLDAAIGH